MFGARVGRLCRWLIVLVVVALTTIDLAAVAGIPAAGAGTSAADQVSSAKDLPALKSTPPPHRVPEAQQGDFSNAPNEPSTFSPQTPKTGGGFDAQRSTPVDALTTDRSQVFANPDCPAPRGLVHLLCWRVWCCER